MMQLSQETETMFRQKISNSLVVPDPIRTERIGFLVSRGIDSDIAEIDLEMVKMKMTDPDEGAGWTVEQCDDAEVEYKRFLALCRKFPYPTYSIVPNKIMDMMWHYHILDTRAYCRDCDKVFGRYFHHFPYFGMRGDERRARVEELLGLVDLPAHFADRQPSELSGGEKQRVALARAFGAEPELIICDEVLSSLDTLVATTILELLKDLKERLGVAYLFVSHDLATVATIADRVIVMYAGRICEQGPTREVFSPPYHPYTDLLISSVPELRTDWLADVLDTREGVSAGRGSAPMDTGCAFRTRCAFAIDGTCDTRTPPARRLDDARDHVVHCHRDVAAAV